MSASKIRHNISTVKINPQFASISLKYFGYDFADYKVEIASLISLWQNQGYVEVYQTSADRRFGLIKDSSINKRGIVISYYIGLFHARLVDGENDPLIVLKFHREDNGDKFVDLKFMLDHDEIFGGINQKYNLQEMKGIQKSIDELIKTSDKNL